MHRSELGRVVNPAALESAQGPRARISIEVPMDWRASRLNVEVPRRLVCARCSGGGCDTCDRSGGVRLPDRLVGTEIVVPLPEELGDKLGDTVEIRLPEPFGRDGPLDQLMVRIRRGMRASPGVHRPLHPMSRVRRVPLRDWAVYALIALIPLIAALSALLIH